MKVSSVFDYILSRFAGLAGILVVFIMFAICTEIVMRDFLNQPQKWVIEVCEYTLIWIAFLSAAWLLKGEWHVKMDMLLNRLSLRGQTILDIVTSAVGLIVCLITTWYGVQMTWDHFQRGIFEPATVLDLPKAPIMVIIPLGFFLLSIQFVRRMYGFVERWRESRNKDQGS